MPENAPARPWRSEAVATSRLAWPLIVTNVAQTAMTATDVILLGQLGAETLAAAALASTLYFATVVFGIGLTGATAPMIASELGRRRHSVRDVRRTVRQGLWAAVAIAVPMWLVLWNTEALLLTVGQAPTLAREAGRYMHTLQWSILPFLFYLVLRSFVSALERPLSALVISLIGVAINAGVGWLLIFGHFGLPALGTVGAGIATTVADLFIFGVLALVVVLDRRFRRYRLFGRWWRADRRRFVELWRLGLPMGAALLFEVAIFNASTLLMGLIGPASIAAHSIALQIVSLSFMVPLGLAQAATVRVGRAFGAGDRDGIRRAGWTALCLGSGFMLAAATVMVSIPHTLIGVFLDTNDPTNRPVIALATTFVLMAALFQLADGAQAVAGGMLRGLHDTRVPMIYAAIGYWGVGLVLGIGLAFGLKLEGLGIWIGLAAGLVVVATLLLVRWQRRETLGLVRSAPSAG